MAEEIYKEMTISEILSKFPQKSQRMAQALTNAGLHCSSCSAATWETLEAGMLGHGMNESSIEKLVKELNEIVSEEFNPDTITLTPRAAKKFREFAKEEGFEKAALRFGDSAGGCGGFQYILDFAQHPEENDIVLISEEVEIYVKKGMYGRLLGSVIDYVDGLQEAGFKVSNPNARSSCGCGKSQGY